MPDDRSRPPAGTGGRGDQVGGTRSNQEHSCPCVCHRPDEIERDLDRQLAEEDLSVRSRLVETSHDVAGACEWGRAASTPDQRVRAAEAYVQALAWRHFDEFTARNRAVTA